MVKRSAGIALSCLIAASAAFGQTAPAKKNARPGATPEPTPPVAETQNTPAKRNERPSDDSKPKEGPVAATPNHFYTFERPGFLIRKILIAHDDAGLGRITFVKDQSNEEITDPLEVSTDALTRIDAALTALDFFNSSDSYQYEKDYSHLGNITIKITRDGKTRETKFNWTNNLKARALADEYRRISNQYVWVFDMNLALENQPLEAPGLMDQLDAQMRRNEISDPKQLLPYLKKLALDERIPLIARNHATRLIDKIAK